MDASLFEAGASQGTVRPSVPKPGRLAEKRDLILVLALLAAWMLDLTVAAVFLYRRSPAAAFFLLAAAMVALAAAIILALRHRRQAAIAWHVMAPAFLVHCGLLIAALVFALLRPMQVFAMDRFALYQVAPFADGTARFAALSRPLPDGRVFLSPIDALILLRLQNRTAQPRLLRDYRVEGYIGGRWQALCEVAFAPNPPYYLSSTASAREIVLTPLAPPAANKTLAPRQARIFWTAWTCPERCSLTAPGLRLIVTEQGGHSETIGFPLQDGGPGLRADFGIGGQLALDPDRQTLYGRRDCASDRRNSRLW